MKPIKELTPTARKYTKTVFGPFMVGFSLVNNVNVKIFTARDYDLNTVCHDICVDETLKCISTCESTDSECLSLCLRSEIDCTQSKPT